MKIDIKKVNKDGKRFSLEFSKNLDNVTFYGSLNRISRDICKMEADIDGHIALICDLSGEEFLQTIRERVCILFKAGIWKGNEVESGKYLEYDVVEIFDNCIDLDYILYSELESIRLGYHTKV